MATETLPMKWGVEDISSVESWRAAAAEFFATGLFVFLGTGGVVSALALSGGDLTPPALAVIALAHGLAIMVLVAATANISGGHINPAVTISLWFVGKIGLGKAVMYIAAQIVGAIVGSLLLMGIVSGPLEGNLGAHGLGPVVDGSAGAGFVAEIILTFALVGTVFATAVHPRGLASYAPAAIGLVVLIDHLVAVPMTGASMNPARSFGPALVANEWSDHWIFWAGPIAGGLIAAVAYRWIFLTKEERAAD